MHEPSFHALRETLLRKGVAPKHVRRTIAELRDHHTDLFSEAYSRGCSFEDAEREASSRLGDEDVLAEQVLARPELRSWTHRWPWLAYCVTPSLFLTLAFAALLVLLGVSGVVRVDEGTFANRWGSPAAIFSFSGAIRLLYSFGLPVLIAGASCFAAGQRRVALKWPVIGVVIASLVGAAIQFNVVWPHGPAASGALALRLSVPPFPGSGGTLLRATVTCALTIGPYLLWRKRAARG